MEINKQEYLESKKELFGEIEVVEGFIKQYFNKRDLAKQFLKIQPLYYDNSKIWWFWNQKDFCWERIDETDILNAINKYSIANTINSKEKNEILEALKQTARENKPEEIKESWIQFGNKIIDIETNEELEATSKHFVTNPVKWNLGKSEETPALDILFDSWVGEEHRQELYEILAFCLAPSYFIHRMFCLIGSGANGKSTYLRVLENFIGEKNLTSSSLYLLLTQRFEGGKLLKKLVCLIGETNFNIINNTDFLKKLTGQDLVRAEFKGKDCFDFRNYAKLIMATNSLPPTSDKTMGFYRRWKIIEFPNKFISETDVLINVLDEEYENLALKCLNILKKLWNHRVFTNEGDFEERKRVYEEKSNPVMLFIKENYEKKVNQDTVFGDFYDELRDFLISNGFRELTHKTISNLLKNEGFEVKKTTKNDVTTTRILNFTRKNTQNTQNTLNPT